MIFQNMGALALLDHLLGFTDISDLNDLLKFCKRDLNDFCSEIFNFSKKSHHSIGPLCISHVGVLRKIAEFVHMEKAYSHITRLPFWDFHSTCDDKDIFNRCQFNGVSLDNSLQMSP